MTFSLFSFLSFSFEDKRLLFCYFWKDPTGSHCPGASRSLTDCCSTGCDCHDNTCAGYRLIDNMAIRDVTSRALQQLIF
jgi:hypothetical protein